MEINLGLMYVLAITNVLVFGARLSIIGHMTKVYGKDIVQSLHGSAKNMIFYMVISFVSTGIVVVMVGSSIVLGWGTNYGTVLLLSWPTIINWFTARWMTRLEEEFWSHAISVGRINAYKEPEDEQWDR